MLNACLGAWLFIVAVVAFLLTLAFILIVNQGRPSVRCNTDLNRKWLLLLFKSRCGYKASAYPVPFSLKAFGSETSPEVCLWCEFWLSCQNVSPKRPLEDLAFWEVCFCRLCEPSVRPLTPLYLNGDQTHSFVFKQSSSVSLRHAGLLSEKHPEEHGVHLSPGEKLHHQQGHPQPLPVLSTAEVPGSGNVQGVWVHLPYPYRLQIERRLQPFNPCCFSMIATSLKLLLLLTFEPQSASRKHFLQMHALIYSKLLIDNGTRTRAKAVRVSLCLAGLVMKMFSPAERERTDVCSHHGTLEAVWTCTHT